MLRNQDLLDALEQILVARNGTISEYKLIIALQKPPYSLFDKDALREPLALFRCHFVLFHHLYQLQKIWLVLGKGMLSIHTTEIRFESTQAGQKQVVEPIDPLRNYYLDWQNFDKTNKQDVEALLASFWQQMASNNPVSSLKNKRKALAILDIQEPFEADVLKRCYRKKQHQHHPDKGGDEQTSKQILWAYKVLKRGK